MINPEKLSKTHHKRLLQLGTLLAGDRFTAGLIVIYVAAFVIGFENVPDFTPMEVLNRIISGQGKFKKMQ